MALSVGAACLALLVPPVPWLLAATSAPAATGMLGLTALPGTTLAFGLAGLASGVLFGKASPRRGWLAALALLWLPAWMVGATAGCHHAGFVLASTAAGWLIGALAATRGLRVWPAASAASVAVVAAALVIGIFDRSWIVGETMKAARGFGARDFLHPVELELQVPMPFQSGHGYAHGRVESRLRGRPELRDTTDLWVDYDSFRRHTLGVEAFAERLVAPDTYVKGAQSLPQALVFARAANLPERYLTRPWQDRVETSAADTWAIHTFTSGSGTWAEPYVQVSSGGLLVQAGVPPH